MKPQSSADLVYTAVEASELITCLRVGNVPLFWLVLYRYVFKEIRRQSFGFSSQEGRGDGGMEEIA